MLTRELESLLARRWSEASNVETALHELAIGKLRRAMRARDEGSAGGTPSPCLP